MFAEGFRDLVKPQWVQIIEALKIAGGLSVPELRARLGGSYMGIKDQCEALRERGYLETWRVPREKIGRPEIMYRLADKATPVFPAAGALSLRLLEAARQLFGDTGPERMLLQHFQRLRDEWQPQLAQATSLVEKATLLSALRDREGCFARCKYDAQGGFRIQEFHHPLRPIFERYPNALHFELRAMEEVLATRIKRREVADRKGQLSRVDYEIVTLGVEAPSAS